MQENSERNVGVELQKKGTVPRDERREQLVCFAKDKIYQERKIKRRAFTENNK